MTLSTLPLSYCTNVHPGRSIAEVETGLDVYTLPIRNALGSPLAAGLWLARPVVDELLASADALANFAQGLARRGLTCHTLNAFPFGDFHSPRVKENVYLPDWTDPRRLDYTDRCARVLAALLSGQAEGSISTMPLGFKGFEQSADFLDRCVGPLIEMARRLDFLWRETGKRIRLAIEPEPFCLLETTPETIAFFDRLCTQADRENAGGIVRETLGVCYDICHQAVEFEDVASSLRAIESAGIRVNKVHISCALQLDCPSANVEARAALARYAEPRYLHQTLARHDGVIERCIDLTSEFASDPPEAFRSADAWRIHFHVPVDADRLGPLSTTRAAIGAALAVVKTFDYAPHLEVETYTWEVMPGAGPADLVQGLTRELTATQTLLAKIAAVPRGG